MPLLFRRDYFKYQKYLQELYKRKQARVYTGIILTIVTISFFTLFALRPTVLTITDLIIEIKQKEEAIKRLDIKIQQLSQAQASYSQVAPRLYLADEALPKEVGLSSLLRNVEIAAAQNETPFSSLSFAEINLDEEAKGLLEIGFELSLKGQFESLRDFLGKIFSLRRVIQDAQLSLNKTEVEEGQSLVLSAQLKSFFQRDKDDKKSQN